MKQSERLRVIGRTYFLFKLSFPAGLFITLIVLFIASPIVRASTCPTSATLKVSRYLPDPPVAGNLNPDMKTDIHAGAKYEKALQELFGQEKFAELDAYAASVRANKSRFSGGGWKLYGFYFALRDYAACGKATDNAEWLAYIEKLKRWVSQRPQSITARVALAEAYEDYAWHIRGNSYANVVAENAWEPFHQNVQLAKDTLDDASALPDKCPHWYLVMQQVGRSQGWGLEELTALLNQAVAFEPLYYYYYREHAVTLEPRWYGEPGDAERFAEQTAARIGGPQGDMVYFEIADTLNCTGCSESKAQFARMSWERMQRGYAAEEQAYGTALHKLNEFAHLAIRAEDRAVALELFVRIGDNWDKATWKTYSYFDGSRQWAWAIPDDLNKLFKASYESRRTREGDDYYRRVEADFTKRYAAALKQCAEAEKDDSEPFEVLIRLASDGAPQEMKAWPPTRLSACFMPKIMTTRFVAPPQPSYPVALGIATRPHTTRWGITAELPDAGE